jgi:hypothetical protein
MKIYVLPILAVLAFSGCKKNTQVDGPFFFLTYDLPEGTYWQVNSDFRAQSDNPLCQTFSFGSGRMEPATKRQSFRTGAKGDTLKVPLFRTEDSHCNWKMESTIIEYSKLEPMLKVGFHFEEGSDSTKQSGAMPDSVHYVCNADGSGCEAEGERPRWDYLVPASAIPPRLHLSLEYR